MTQDNPDHLDEGAKALAKWIGYKWEGITEGRIGDRGFDQWCFNGMGHKQFQGGKQDLRDLAKKIATLVNGEIARE